MVTTQFVAHLIYFIRCTVFYIIKDSPSEVDQLIKYSQADENTLFFQLKKIASLLRAMNESESDKYSIEWDISNPQKELNCLKFNGLRYYISDFADGYRQQLILLRNLLEKNFYGFRPFNIDYSFLSSIREETACRTPGYNFIKDKRNGFIHEQQRKYLQHIRNVFPMSCLDSDSTKGKLEGYLSNCKLFMRHFIVLMHISSGMPSRGTELSTLTVINDRHGKRSVFFAYNTIALRQLYSKTDDLTSRPTNIVRYLTESLRDLLLYYLVYIRPIQTYV